MFVPLFLVACGGGGGSGGGSGNGGVPPGGSNSAKVTLFGVAFDAAVVGGTVTIKNLNGTVLGTVTTGADGKFSLDVVEDGLKNGYSLSVTGGTMDGVAFTGTLTATYSSTDAKTAINLTPITTLIDQLAADLPGATPLEKHNAAIQKLASLGMVKPDDWNLLTSGQFNLSALASRISAKGGMQAWIDLIKADLADGELSVEEMAGFPKTNGGIAGVSLQGATDGVFSTFIGDVLQSKITVSGQDGASYQYQAVTAPNGLTVGNDGAVTYTVPEGTTENQNIPLAFKVTNVATGLGRTVSANIYPMKRNVTAEKTIAPSLGGQVVSSVTDDTSVKISTDGMTVSGKVEIVQGINAAGNPQTTFRFDKNIKGTVEITLPDPNAPAPSALSTKSVQSQPQVRAALRNVDIQAKGSKYPLIYSWLPWNGWFLNTEIEDYAPFYTGNRVSKEKITVSLEGAKPKEYTADKSQASELLSDCSKENDVCFKGKVPILFVHGFLPSNKLGGGEGTWKYFPHAIKDEISNAVLFEFKWRTAARFEDAAGDLAAAVKMISEKTGQKVHIIAHSFGGVLTRTYLQGLATGVSYNNDVASVTTIGSPHSGIFDVDSIGNKNSAGFSIGQDSYFGAGASGLISGGIQIDNCAQLSCYEMGEYVRFNDADKQAFQVDKYSGGFISQLSDMEKYPLPDELQLQVLIGLAISKKYYSITDDLLGRNPYFEVGSGDGLISFEGQRINPKLAGNAKYLSKETKYGGVITETLLGMASTIYPGSILKDNLSGNLNGLYGYRHSSLPVGPNNAVPEVQVNEDSCWDIETDCADKSNHQAFLRARDWINTVGNQPYAFVPDFSVDTRLPTVGVNVGFLAKTKNSITSYAWEFGDGATDAPIGLPKAITSHTYTKAGPYTVKLTVMDGVVPTTVTKDITVGEAIDSDGDRMPDYWELKYGLNPKVNDAGLDSDVGGGDGLTNLQEFNAGTDPTKADTDGDGFTDKQEVDAGTSPTDPNDWPLVLNAIAGDGQVKLVWNHAPAAPAVEHYNVCYATATIDPIRANLSPYPPD